ncbi:MAG TPA: hypothetical protein DEH22_15830 [Chloroflexi bacterium]|nr:hypothetical protein [Chloroflexota bacterium]
MKMIVVVLNDDDAEAVTKAIASSELPVTRVASTGGFLRQGSSTLMIGVNDTDVDEAIRIINANCTPSVEPMSKRATLFVLNVEHFEQR